MTDDVYPLISNMPDEIWSIKKRRKKKNDLKIWKNQENCFSNSWNVKKNGKINKKIKIKQGLKASLTKKREKNVNLCFMNNQVTGDIKF